jgi:hypothetical protein
MLPCPTLSCLHTAMPPFLTLMHPHPSLLSQCAAAKGYWLRRPCKRKRSSRAAFPLPIKPIIDQQKFTCAAAFHSRRSQITLQQYKQQNIPLQSTPPPRLLSIEEPRPVDLQIPQQSALRIDRDIEGPVQSHRGNVDGHLPTVHFAAKRKR